MKRLFSRGQKETRTFHLLQVEPTLHCNLCCTMCPWLGEHASEKIMTWDTFERIARHFPQVQNVDLSGGGEPLLHPSLIDMVSVAKRAGCTTGFSTNATLLRPDISRALVKAGLDWIAFSIDAATAETYENIRRGARFETVTKNIRAMQEAKIELDSATPEMLLIYVLMHTNLDELPAAIDLAAELGIRRVAVKNLDVILKPGDEAQTWLDDEPAHSRIQVVAARAQDRARRHGLSMRTYSFSPTEASVCECDPLHNIFINWHGCVAPCITLMYNRPHYFRGVWHSAQPQLFGNINKENLLDIWEQDRYRQFRNQFIVRQQTMIANTIAATLASDPGSSQRMPPAPARCQTCYYLYGM